MLCTLVCIALDHDHERTSSSDILCWLQVPGRRSGWLPGAHIQFALFPHASFLPYVLLTWSCATGPSISAPAQQNMRAQHCKHLQWLASAEMLVPSVVSCSAAIVHWCSSSLAAAGISSGAYSFEHPPEQNQVLRTHRSR
jgi:hypothetical protein